MIYKGMKRVIPCLDIMVETVLSASCLCASCVVALHVLLKKVHHRCGELMTVGCGQGGMKRLMVCERQRAREERHPECVCERKRERTRS